MMVHRGAALLFVILCWASPYHAAPRAGVDLTARMDITDAIDGMLSRPYDGPRLASLDPLLNRNAYRRPQRASNFRDDSHHNTFDHRPQRGSSFRDEHHHNSFDRGPQRGSTFKDEQHSTFNQRPQHESSGFLKLNRKQAISLDKGPFATSFSNQFPPNIPSINRPPKHHSSEPARPQRHAHRNPHSQHSDFSFTPAYSEVSHTRHSTFQKPDDFDHSFNEFNDFFTTDRHHNRRRDNSRTGGTSRVKKVPQYQKEQSVAFIPGPSPPARILNRYNVVRHPSLSPKMPRRQESPPNSIFRRMFPFMNRFRRNRYKRSVVSIESNSNADFLMSSADSPPIADTQIKSILSSQNSVSRNRRSASNDFLPDSHEHSFSKFENVKPENEDNHLPILKRTRRQFNIFRPFLPRGYSSHSRPNQQNFHQRQKQNRQGYLAEQGPHPPGPLPLAPQLPFGIGGHSPFHQGRRGNAAKKPAHIPQSKFASNKFNSFQPVDNSILGSGNFEVISGGTFYGKDDSHFSHHRYDPFLDDSRYHRPQSNNHVDGFFSNFRDFSEFAARRSDIIETTHPGENSDDTLFGPGYASEQIPQHRQIPFDMMTSESENDIKKQKHSKKKDLKEKKKIISKKKKVAKSKINNKKSVSNSFKKSLSPAKFNKKPKNIQDVLLQIEQHGEDNPSLAVHEEDPMLALN